MPGRYLERLSVNDPLIWGVRASYRDNPTQPRGKQHACHHRHDLLATACDTALQQDRRPLMSEAMTSYFAPKK